MAEEDITHYQLYERIVENHAETSSQLKILAANMEVNGEKADKALEEVHTLREEVNTGKNTVKFLVWLGSMGTAIAGIWVALKTLGGNG